MKNIILLVILFFHLLEIPPAVAQQPSLQWDILGESSNRLEGKLTGTVFQYSVKNNIRHFLHEKWMPGDVVLEDGDNYKNLRIRYNAFNDQLVAYNENLHQMYIPDKSKISSFTVREPGNEQQFVKLYQNSVLGGNWRFFERRYEGSRWFLIFHQIVEEKTNVYRNEYGKLKDTELKNRTVRFMYNPDDGKFSYLYNSRRAFVKMFPDNKKEVRRIFRRNRLYNFNDIGMAHAFRLLDEAGLFQKE